MNGRIVLALVVGLLFGSGLVISGMTDTARVQGFLDPFGQWDPTLAFVMGGALIPMAIAWRVATKRDQAILGGALPSAASTQLDVRLLAGAAIFGLGWGLVGLCPGPALAGVGLLDWRAVIFVLAMIVGMYAGVRVGRPKPLAS